LLSTPCTGYGKATINGADTAPAERLGPWTTWAKRILYRAHNITALLQPGQKNCLGVAVGNGQYRSIWTHAWARQTPPLGLLAHLRLRYANGTVQSVVSTSGANSPWRSTQGPTTHDDVYSGESFDARLVQPSWDQPHFQNASSWDPVLPFKTGDVFGTTPTLSLHRFVPIRLVGTRKPAKITQPAPGVFVAHFETNFVGVSQISVKGPAGASIFLGHAEQLRLANGSVCLVDCREFGPGAVAQGLAYYPFQGANDSYILRGSGDVETWHPLFTYHGYQFVQINGWPASEPPPTPDNITGLIIHSDVPVTGLLHFPATPEGQLLSNIDSSRRRSLLSNFHSVQEDCPTRERVG
jgi:alpha-L-rhamnosidase